ncbi:hypothetical protein PVK06_036861 [Gossypium arboreum]|uniref:Uncharacterized protein n=1 Tax=Gossypium arboreum TaxID=29729 RepID=A0ABR0NLU7_GOSAR|nr:hypothetical protein PVK06_036861 [Gossypium arboreum]
MADISFNYMLVNLAGVMKILWLISISTACWSIWLVRNEMVFNQKMKPMDTMIFHSKMKATMWVRVVHNEVILTECSWWFCPLKCRSHNKTYKGLEMSWWFPPRGWLKFKVCGVVFKDKASYMKLVPMWCLNGSRKQSQDLESYTIFFAEIERISYLSFGKAEHMGNKLAFALAIVGVKRSDTFSCI